MKYFLSFFICANLIHFDVFSEDTSIIYNANTKNIMGKQEQTIRNEVSKQITDSFSQNTKAATSQNGANDIMIIDPKIVSSDWTLAFNSLKAKKLPDIIFSLKDNIQISDVFDVEPLPGGYLMLFSLRTPSGTKYKIIKTSDICSISSR